MIKTESLMSYNWKKKKSEKDFRLELIIKQQNIRV